MSFKNIKQLALLIFTVLYSQIGLSQTTTFNYIGESETFEIEAGVTRIQIEVSGGQGGDGDGGVGGLGATMIGTFDVEDGDILTVIVGGAGEQFGNSGGGGGGSGVLNGAVPLIIAGGGGGAATNAGGHGGLIIEDGGSASGIGGSGGQGGEKGYVASDCGWAAGGGGFLGDGYGGTVDWDGGAFPGVLGGEGGGKSWANGGAGGINGGCDFVTNSGAWGCGGGGAGEYGGAGGGGYSGGAGGQYIDTDASKFGGGGGGSYSDGMDQINTEANHAGAGEIIITIICGPETIELDATVGDEIVGSDGSIELTVSGDHSPYTYDWDTDEADDFDDEEDLFDLVSGTYTVIIKDSVGCEKTETYTINSQVSLIEFTNKNLHVYPNPTDNFLTIETKGIFNAKLYNLNGQLLTSISGQNVAQISLEKFPVGNYLLYIDSEDSTEIIKVLKQ